MDHACSDHGRPPGLPEYAELKRPRAYRAIANAGFAIGCRNVLDGKRTADTGHACLKSGKVSRLIFDKDPLQIGVETLFGVGFEAALGYVGPKDGPPGRIEVLKWR